MKFKSVAVIALAAIMATPALAADDAKKEKKGKKAQPSPTAALLKQLEPVGLTDDQVAKIKSIGTAAQEAMQAARKEAGITRELQEKLAEAQKSMKDSELKGKERAAALHKAAGLTEAQAAALTKANELRTKMNRDVFAVLTDEQKAKLPEKLQRLAGPGKGGAKKGDAKKGGAKKKKDAA